MPNLISFTHTKPLSAISVNRSSLSFLQKLFITIHTLEYLPLSLGLGVPNAGLGSFTSIFEPAVRKNKWYKDKSVAKCYPETRKIISTMEFICKKAYKMMFKTQIRMRFQLISNLIITGALAHICSCISS